MGCRLEYSRQWAIRMLHESQLHETCTFITLTYDEKHLPKNKSLNKKHFQKFMKRLRRAAPGIPIRYYHCGEYGDKFLRPHYHAILFGVDFLDKTLHKKINGFPCYKSEALTQIWGKGFCAIADVTFESAAYVARYVTKKITGKKALTHYEFLDMSTGELIQRQPEYSPMLRKKGIASEWIQKHYKDVYPSDFIIIRERKCKPPKYYNQWYEKHFPEKYEKVKAKRLRESFKRKDQTSEERMIAKEEIMHQKFARLIRSYENGTEDL